MKICHYVVIRSDVPVGTQLAQVVHAAGESFGKSPPKCRSPDEPIFAVALAAESEQKLIGLEEKLEGGRD